MPTFAPYGDTAATEAHGGPKWIYVREDKLERLVLSFFEQRIFGPLRIQKLSKQIRAEAKSRKRDGKLTGTRIRQQVADLDRKIKAQVIAIEEGVEPEIVSQRISELREQKSALEEALQELGGEQEDTEEDRLIECLESIPDLSQSLRKASPQIRRQVYEAFDLQIAFDKREGRVEISATVAEEVANALNNSEELFAKGNPVTLANIAGAGFEPATFGL